VLAFAVQLGLFLQQAYEAASTLARIVFGGDAQNRFDMTHRFQSVGEPWILDPQQLPLKRCKVAQAGDEREQAKVSSAAELVNKPL
jgi:hypothetical protein